MGVMTVLTASPEVFRSDWTAAPLGDGTHLARAYIAPFYVFESDTTGGSAASGAAELEASGTIAAYVSGSVPEKSPLRVIRLASSTERSKGKSNLGAGLIPERSIILQHWEGVVLFREEDTFTVRIFDGYRDFPVKRCRLWNQMILQ
jgi:hypothetical protein